MTSFSEQTGIVASKYFGAKNYPKMKTSLVYGLLIATIVSIGVIFPIYYFSDKICLFIGIELKVAAKTRQLLLLSTPIIVTTAIGDQILSFCYSQEIEKYFGWINIAGFIVSSPLMYYLMSYKGLSADGYIYTRIFNEVFNFLAYLIVYFFVSKKETIGLSLSQWNTTEFFIGSWNGFKYALNNYAGYIGLEINTVYVGMLSDTTALSAYVLSQNITEMYFLMGLATSTIYRTRINTLVGLKKYKTLERFHWSFFISNFLFGVLLGSFLFIFRRYVSMIYTSSRAV